jgi:signal transduction histidine kinase/tetratricopeptide (TPR) repeat protein
MLSPLQSWFRNRTSKFIARSDSRYLKRSTYVKQTLLFLLAVVLPSSALVLLSLRMIAQERELAENRSRERREQMGRQFGETLSRHLREVADRVAALTPAQVRGGEWRRLDPDLALVAVVAKDRLVLPWEHNPQAEVFAELLRQAPFGDSLAAGQRFEFGQGELKLALASYQEAVARAGIATQREYASLAVARVLSKMGAAEDAEKQIEPVLKHPSTSRDEFDVPLTFYAAGQLLKEGRQLERVLSIVAGSLGPMKVERRSPTRLERADMSERAGSETGAPDPSAISTLSPAATCMARDYMDQLRARLPGRKEEIEKLLRQVDRQMALHEQSEQLKNAFPVVRVALAWEQTGSGIAKRWTLHGKDPWLVSMVQQRGLEEPALVAVKAANLCARVIKAGAFAAFTPEQERRSPTRHESADVSDLGESETGVPQIVRGPHSRGVALGEEFPNLHVILPTSAFASRGSEPQLRLYSALIVLVVGVTLFGAYLWWRDTRRELKLAEMRSDFVSSVSHELKTPLTSVQMLAETMRIRDVAPKERNEYLDLILSESERLGRLLKNVLDFSQIEKGTKVYQLEPVELGPVIDAAVCLVQRPLREKHLELAVLNNGADIALNADRDALEQAVLNLLYNAIKYSGKDGRIELRVERVSSEAVIQVRDYGVGVHPRDHERIFERFYRAPEDHNRRIPGTGLGLSLVKHIVESHGGRVTVESAPGQGSTFAIHLPVREGGADSSS